MLLLVGVGLAACGANASPPEPADQRWGPLAVVPPADAAATALIQGTLRIAGGCVVLDERGEEVLLLWPADRTTWNDRTRTVTFENVDGTTVTLAGGDEVELGGGGMKMACQAPNGSPRSSGSPRPIHRA